MIFKRFCSGRIHTNIVIIKKYQKLITYLKYYILSIIIKNRYFYHEIVNPEIIVTCAHGTRRRVTYSVRRSTGVGSDRLPVCGVIYYTSNHVRFATDF